MVVGLVDCVFGVAHGTDVLLNSDGVLPWMRFGFGATSCFAAQICHLYSFGLFDQIGRQVSCLVAKIGGTQYLLQRFWTFSWSLELLKLWIMVLLAVDDGIYIYINALPFAAKTFPSNVFVETGFCSCWWTSGFHLPALFGIGQLALLAFARHHLLHQRVCERRLLRRRKRHVLRPLRRMLPNHCISPTHYPGQRHLYIGRLLISNWLIMHKIITWLFKSWLISRFKILH